MKHTESYFGLQGIDGKITADNGETFLSANMTAKDFDNLVSDIENWKEETLTESDIEDLKEILNR